MALDMNKVKEMLDKYQIGDIDELEDALKKNTKYQIDKKENCSTAQNFKFNIPDCRVFAEVHNMYYSDISAIKFADALYNQYKEVYSKIKEPIEKKMVGKSSIEGYIICKNCNPEDEKAPCIKRPILKDVLCDFIPFPTETKKIFGLSSLNVSKLIEVLTPTKEKDYRPLFEEEKRENMTKEEKEKLYKVVYVTKNQLKENLQDKEKIEGSDEYKFNLALYAFDRNLAEESLKIIEDIKDSNITEYDEYHHLHAKVFSTLDKEEKAIEVLEVFIRNQKSDKINTESYNLLSASIKRKAFQDYENNNITDKEFCGELRKAKDNYSNIYSVTKNYYPAINIIYLLIMTAEFCKDEIEIEDAKNEANKIWENSDIQKELNKKDWWSFISDVEYLILTGKYEEGLKKLNNYKHELNEENINDFNIASTIRQMKLFFDITQNMEVKKIIIELEKMQEDKESLEYFKEK